MANWWQNIFGSLGNRNIPVPTGIDFIPNGVNGDVTKDKDIIWVNGGEPAWIGLGSTRMQYWAYCFCSPLSAVIDRLGEADINGSISFLKNNGSDDPSNSAVTKRLKKLFTKPNPLQTWYQFRGQQVVYKKTFGYCPVFAMIPSTFDVTETQYLWNLNPYYVKPKINPKFSLFSNQHAIESWTLKTQNGTIYDLPSDKIFIIQDGYLEKHDDNSCLPMSKIYGLDWAISNICAAMEADNVLLKKKGPLGFISHDPKPDNVAGYIPMSGKEKDEIQKNLAQYGLTWSQWQFVISKLPIRWNPMSFNVRDLMTKETTRQSIDMICDRFNYPAELMSGKNATYENRSSAEKFMYQNNVIPSSLRDMIQYSNFFEMEENGIKFIQDYSKLPVLQEDIVKAGEAAANNASANLILFQNCVITLNQWRVSQGIDSVEGDDIYFPQYVKKYKVPTAAPEMKPVPGSKKQAA